MFTKSYTSVHVRIALLLALIAAAFGALPVHAAVSIRYVKWNAGGANNGTSWANAYTSLQTALTAASSDTEIWVAAGIYKPTAGTDRTLSFTLKNGVAMYGGFAGTETLRTQRDPATNLTTLSGDIGIAADISDNSYHVVVGGATNNTAVLDGLTITAGNANSMNEPYDRGGGMFNENSSPTLANLVFSNNSADSFGGGIYNYQSHPVLTGITFLSNISYYLGGGMYNEGFSSPVLMDVTFRRNTAVGGGGGMANLGSSNPSLTDVEFIFNDASVNGGGMTNSYNSSPTLNGVTFLANSAGSQGGGMSNSGNSNPTLNQVAFIENTADSAASHGGGMVNSSSNPVLLDVAFNNNWALSGGGMHNVNSSPVLTSVTFSDNAAGEGGGMRNVENSNPILTNVTFSGNQAGSAGGILNYLSNPILVNVTLSGNSASAMGGGIANVSSAPSLTNVILWGNTANTSPEIHNVSSSPTVTYSIIQGGYAGTGNLNADPLLGPLQDNGGFTKTMALGTGSPAMNAGSDANCPDTDQRGMSRPQGTNCDIGAYEVYEVPPTFTDVPFDHWAWSFIERLYSAGITGGCGSSPLQYCPETTVTRSQMAVFLLRGIHSSSFNPPAVGASTGFGDVPVDYWSAAWIKQLAAEGITGGCGSGNYCPEYPVTRDQMAVFLLRSKYGASYSPPGVGISTGFGDVPTDHWAAPWIKQLVTEGITAGCGSGNYCPELPVTRAQMAVFLVRTFSLP